MFRVLSSAAVAVLAAACAEPRDVSSADPPKTGGMEIQAAPGDPAAQRMFAVFKQAREDVVGFWGEPFPEDVKVTLARDRAAFDAAFPEEWGFASECWMVGAGVADFLIYLSPTAWPDEACEHDPADDQHVRDIAVHELAHVYHGQNNPTRDFTGIEEEVGWFAEGLAVVVAGQLDRDRYSDPADAIRSGAVPERLRDAWSGPHRYAVAGSIALYIDETHGREALRDLMAATSQDAFLARLGVTEEELLAGWRAWALAR